ncbi:MAG: hypothetical protein JNL30_07610 [Rubrivivax sp.]|nr:hypothetical protein [Rubrivivax sp.]
MTLFAHHAGPRRPGVADRDLELVHARYVAVPALMWGAAVVLALLFTAVQTAPAHLAGQPPAVPGDCDCTVHGA